MTCVLLLQKNRLVKYTPGKLFQQKAQEITVTRILTPLSLQTQGCCKPVAANAIRLLWKTDRQQ